jgi:Rab-like protein 2
MSDPAREDGKRVEEDEMPDPDYKVILLGDSAVGKSKLVERYLIDDYNPRQLSTYALTLFRKDLQLEGETKTSTIDFWDTAGQESFNRMHPSYYYRAHCCILVFDVTRKITYQHLADWYAELREYCSDIPVVLVANKIDVDYNVTRKNFKFAAKHNLPFFFVSAADGTNVVKVFQSAINEARRYKEGGGDVMGEMLSLLNTDSTTLRRTQPSAESKRDREEEEEDDFDSVEHK